MSTLAVELAKPPKRGPKARKRIARGKGPRKQRKTTLAALKRKLWSAFALYVKDRDGRICFTCDAVVEGTNCHAGHLFSIRKASTAYDPANVHVQCGRCNVWLRGNTAVYAARFLDRYGIEKFNVLHARQKVTHEWKRHELEELIAALAVGGAEFEMLYAERYGVVEAARPDATKHGSAAGAESRRVE